MSRSTAHADHEPVQELRPCGPAPLGLRAVREDRSLARADLASLLALALDLPDAPGGDLVVAMLRGIDRDADVLQQAIALNELDQPALWGSALISIRRRAVVAAELHRRLLEEGYSECSPESAADQSSEVQ